MADAPVERLRRPVMAPGLILNEQQRPSRHRPRVPTDAQQDPRFLAETRVIVHSLGDGREYSGVIKGVSEFRSNLGMPGRYTVECDYATAHFGYPCFSVPEGCVRLAP